MKIFFDHGKCYVTRADQLSLPLFPRWCSHGEVSWKQGDYNERSHSNVFAVELVTDGNLRLVQDGREHIVEPGQLYILQKHVSHRYETGPRGYLKKRYIGIDGPALEPILMSLELNAIDIIKPNDLSAVTDLFDSIEHTLAPSENGNESELSILAYRLLMALGEGSRPELPPAIIQTIDFMRKHIGSSLTNDMISSHAGCSNSYILALFKEHLDCTPLQYFNRLRLNQAKTLLDLTNYSIKEIAKMLGFCDQLYFSSVFKKHTGMSPTDFKRRKKYVEHGTE